MLEKFFDLKAEGVTARSEILAGATVFFVPPANYKDAKSEAGSMKVYQVTTLEQALQDLQSLGGQIPKPVPAQVASK